MVGVTIAWLNLLYFMVGDKLVEAENRVDLLLDFLKTIYKSDEMAESFESYIDFEKFKRSKNENIQNLLQIGIIHIKKLRKMGVS